MGYEIPGVGVIGGDVVASIQDRFDTHIARVLLDERTGVLIETGRNTYLPNQAMRRFVQARDGHCRFPGCARAAARCEADHVIPYSRGGPTAAWNIACLCKHHHRVKHQARWTLGNDPRGRVHLDRPLRPPVRHPPHRPPPARRLNTTAARTASSSAGSPLLPVFAERGGCGGSMSCCVVVVLRGRLATWSSCRMIDVPHDRCATWSCQDQGGRCQAPSAADTTSRASA
jgi:hypothetical protein